MSFSFAEANLLVPSRSRRPFPRVCPRSRRGGLHFRAHPRRRRGHRANVGDEAAELKGLTLDEVADAIEDVRKSHADVDPNSAQFRRLTLEEVARRRSAGKLGPQSYSLPGTGVVLTDAEASLILDHPLNAVSTRLAAGEAMSRASAWFPGEQYQTIADAFRHSYWNVLLAKRVDVTWAEQYTTAHESESGGDDKAMDLNNNQVGRNVYLATPSASEDQLAAILYVYPKVLVSSAASMSPAYLVYLQ